MFDPLSNYLWVDCGALDVDATINLIDTSWSATPTSELEEYGL